MTELDFIARKSDALVKKYGTRDPQALARLSGVKLWHRSDFRELKGMYQVILRNRFIFLNANLSEEETRVVCAHELGHDALHRHFAAQNGLRDSSLWDLTLKPEFEANLFAANLLLSDESALEAIREERTLEQASARLAVPPALLSLKALFLREKGHRIPETPYDSRFLAK